MEERPVGADSIRPNPRISGSTQVNVHATVGVDILVDPYRGRFVLRADAIRPDGAGLYFSANGTSLPAQ